MSQKRILYTILFCLWIGINYFGVWGNLSQEMADSFAYNADPPIYLSTFQLWVFNVFSIIFDSIFIAVAVGVLAYHHRNYKPWRYILFGLFLRYMLAIFVLSYTLYHNVPIFDELFKIVDYQTYILGAIHFVFAVLASYVGMSYGIEAEYLDEKDEQLGYLAGCSKKLWALLMLVYNPVYQLTTKFSIVLVYNLTTKVTSSDYWDYSFSNIIFSSEDDDDTGITGILITLGTLFMIWLIAFGLFYYGIETIRDKKVAYRRAKIIGIFVVIPILVVGIPIIRNRRFFF